MNLRLFLAFSLAAFATAGFGQFPIPVKGYVLTDKEAVGLLDPEIVSGSKVDRASWSPDGNYVLAIRISLSVGAGDLARILQSPTVSADADIVDVSLVSWGFTSRKSNELFRIKEWQGHVYSLDWLPGTSSAIVEIERGNTPGPTGKPPVPQTQFAFVNCQSNSVRVLATIPENEAAQLTVSPHRALAALVTGPMSGEATGHSITIFGADGTSLGRIALPDHVKTFYSPEWGEDGDGPYVVQYTRNADGAHSRHTFRCDTVSGLLVAADDAKLYEEQPREPVAAAPGSRGGAPIPRVDKPVPMLSVLEVKGTVAAKKAALPVTEAWLAAGIEGPFQTAAVSPDVTYSELSPTANGVLYIAQGVAMVRPLMHVSKDFFLKAKAIEERAAALNKAKQVSLGILMYAGDNDDKYPGKNDNLQSILGPYLKDDSLLNGFVYTYNGGLLTDLASPASTEIGYVNGPGGVAVAYADGHVKWRGN